MDSDRVSFVTTVTLQRIPLFRRETTARLLIETLSHDRDAGKFLLHEFVIMPDHVHVLLTPPKKSPWNGRCNSSKAASPTD